MYMNDLTLLYVQWYEHLSPDIEINQEKMFKGLTRCNCVGPSF